MSTGRLADEIHTTITFESMKSYLWRKADGVDPEDIRDFFQNMNPNAKQQIAFSQFVKFVDEDGDFMRAFRHFIKTGSSRTDRNRNWLDGEEDEDNVEWHIDDESKEGKRVVITLPGNARCNPGPVTPVTPGNTLQTCPQHCRHMCRRQPTSTSRARDMPPVER